jgi:hypothetical protein
MMMIVCLVGALVAALCGIPVWSDNRTRCKTKGSSTSSFSNIDIHPSIHPSIHHSGIVVLLDITKQSTTLLRSHQNVSSYRISNNIYTLLDCIMMVDNLFSYVCNRLFCYLFFFSACPVLFCYSGERMNPQKNTTSHTVVRSIHHHFFKEHSSD